MCEIGAHLSQPSTLLIPASGSAPWGRPKQPGISGEGIGSKA